MIGGLVSPEAASQNFILILIIGTPTIDTIH
jgi:hypothetical protein